MKHTILAAACTLVALTGIAQTSTTQASLTRFTQKKGTFVLWYGEGKIVREYAAFQASFEEPYTEQEVVNELKKKVFKSSKYIGYEFKGNFDCNAVQSFIAREMNVKLKDVQDLRVGNCTQLHNPFRKTAEPVAAINKAAFDALNPVVSHREKALLNDGWKKVYDEYSTNALAAEVNLKPGYAYTGLGGFHANGDTALTGKIIISEGTNVLGGFETYPTNDAVLLEVNDFYTPKGLSAAIFSVHPSLEKPYKSALAVYEKPVDFKRDFYRLIEARNDGFKAIRSNRRAMNTEGFYSYSSAISLGVNKAKINETATVIEFMLVMDMLNPQTLAFLDNLIPVLQELPAKGYKADEYKNKAGGDVTTITKDGEEIMLLVSYPAKNEVYFYLFKNKK